MKTTSKATVVTIIVRDEHGSARTRIYDASVEEVTKVLGAGFESAIGEEPEWKVSKK